jgi:endothelin-converting enzyme/putative endopeptidase
MRSALLASLLLCPVALGAEAPLSALPYSPSLDPADMDPTVDPCTDFYAYSCGGWLKANPIPSDRARWSVYGKLMGENERLLWGVLEAAAKPGPRASAEQKSGDAFASCMDEAAVDARGLAPLKADLDAIDALTTPAQLPALLASLHQGFAHGALFELGSGQDYGDSSRVIAFVSAAGLGLPDRDYYVKTDARSVETRAKYVEAVAALLTLTGEAPEAAKAHADQVLSVETALAQASLTMVEKRDPAQLHHLLTRAQLQALTPGFDWSAYLTAEGLARVREVNVTEPRFLEAMAPLVSQGSLPALKTYLRWQVVLATAPVLPRAVREARFAFFSKYLRGVAEEPPRWKQCVQWVDRSLGEALGQAYVKRVFSPRLKAATVEMTRAVERAMEDEIAHLEWMSAPTRKAALAKLHAIRNKVGYPDAWRDYTKLTITPVDYAGNARRATAFEARRQLEKIGKPLDRGEWQMTPPTVNAYYDPQMNDINFPAGVLLPPLFDPSLDEAPNYGNTGATIGHELTHAFDDEGRQFDGQGTLRDWWTPADAKGFTERAQCIVDQYAQYVIVDDVKLNSKLTLGEDVADLGGTLLAYRAWKAVTAKAKLAPMGGFTPDQRFFIGAAQWACESERPESARVTAVTNPHSPGRYRINGVVANLPEFQAAFQCTATSPMVRQSPCKVW